MDYMTSLPFGHPVCGLRNDDFFCWEITKFLSKNDEIRLKNDEKWWFYGWKHRVPCRRATTGTFTRSIHFTRFSLHFHSILLDVYPICPSFTQLSLNFHSTFTQVSLNLNSIWLMCALHCCSTIGPDGKMGVFYSLWSAAVIFNLYTWRRCFNENEGFDDRIR